MWLGTLRFNVSANIGKIVKTCALQLMFYHVKGDRHFVVLRANAIERHRGNAFRSLCAASEAK